MKISGDAETSAQTGIPSYTVREDDRSVTWTLTKETLDDMKLWDALPLSEKRVHFSSGAWAKFGPQITQGRGSVGDISWYELHAVVARNALRHFLGLSEGAAETKGK